MPQRDAILTQLTQRMRFRVPDGVCTRTLNNQEGDALDSVIAAVATFHTLRDSIEEKDLGHPTQVEGPVYMESAIIPPR